MGGLAVMFGTPLSVRVWYFALGTGPVNGAAGSRRVFAVYRAHSGHAMLDRSGQPPYPLPKQEDENDSWLMMSPM
jgi:hypothetical protein